MPQSSKKHKQTIAQTKPAEIKSKETLRSRIKTKRKDFLSRRPHRSFRMTNRRDYRRSLDLGGFLALTSNVIRLIVANRKLFLYLALLFIGSMVIFSTFGTIQSNYENVDQALQEVKTSEIGDQVGFVGQAALAAVTMFSSGGANSGDQSQQIMLSFSILATWLAVVWLMRAIMNGKKVQLRDALYNCGAPIVATLPLLMYAFLQTLPIIMMAIVYSALSITGYVDNGFGSMIFWTVAVLVLTLSFYWLTTTFLALIIVTLPNMRPVRALSIAGDMVVGRRLRIMLRIVWAIVLGLAGWFLFVIPMVMFDSWIKSVWQWISWLPMVPVAVMIANATIVIWLASYVYVLYRKVVDDDAKPA
ncbi:MAG: hypothetical protein WBB94_03520 [Candidatus Saccharimonadaceae bacterium]